MTSPQSNPHPISMPTPAGLQAMDELTRRRWFFIGFNLVLYVIMASFLANLLGQDHWAAPDIGIFLCFLVMLPWSVLGFTNASLGLWLLHVRKNGLEAAAPFAMAGQGDAAIFARTALVMTLRNEDAARAIHRLRCMAQALQASGQGDAFAYFVLSDSSDPAIIAAEAHICSQWPGVHYRRRIDNSGYKAGNIRDFCEQFGSAFEFMLPLDADSLMSAQAILQLVRMGQAHPKIGILQSLVVGAPANSAFARLFQFGMRHGMRPYSMGSTWWSGDCGQFWGHNALVRIKPFVDHCALPELPGRPPFGGAILSHDQVEAAWMRAAGFEVRVLPVESESFEDNPPNFLEFARRDQRWCAGNMQYGPLLRWPGLLPTSRFQLLWAMTMFIGLPALNLLLVFAALRGLNPQAVPASVLFEAKLFYAAILALLVFPKLAGFVDIALTRGEVARYGGAWRFGVGAVCELVFSFLISAITSFCTTLFLLRLPFGGRAIWSGQSRDAAHLPLAQVVRALWPATLFGLGLWLVLAWRAPELIAWSLPFTAGLVLAIPLTLVSAAGALGEALKTHKICAMPEEFHPPSILQALARAPNSEKS